MVSWKLWFLQETSSQCFTNKKSSQLVIHNPLRLIVRKCICMQRVQYPHHFQQNNSMVHRKVRVITIMQKRFQYEPAEVSLLYTVFSSSQQNMPVKQRTIRQLHKFVAVVLARSGIDMQSQKVAEPPQDQQGPGPSFYTFDLYNLFWRKKNIYIYQIRTYCSIKFSKFNGL